MDTDIFCTHGIESWLMVFACSFFIGLVAVSAYRLFRHGTILPAANESRGGVWLKMAALACPIVIGVWVALTLVQRFPD